MAAPAGGLALDRGSSSRCARNTQLDTTNPAARGRIIGWSFHQPVATLRGNIRSIALTQVAQASGEWHGPTTFPAQFKALRADQLKWHVVVASYQPLQKPAQCSPTRVTMCDWG